MSKELQLSEIQLCIKKHQIIWTNHVLIRLIQRNILQSDVEYAIMNGKIIEQYPDDYPNSSCLILGFTTKEKILHVVCGINEGNVWIITAYEPDSSKWNEDFSKRI